MERDKVDRWLEGGILASVLAGLVLAPLLFGGVGPRESALLHGVVALATVLWLLRLWVNRHFRLQWPPMCWCALAFLTYALVRYFQADVEYVARQELLRLLAYAWLFFVVLNNLHRQGTTQVLIAVMVGLGAVLAVYAVFQFVTKSNSVWWFARPVPYAGRGSATFVCPNHAAGYLELLFPLALAIVVLSRQRALGRILFGYCGVVMLAGMAATVSRGGYVAALTALGVLLTVLAWDRRHRIYVLAGAVVLALCIGGFAMTSFHAQKRVRITVSQQREGEEPGRIHVWRSAMAMWSDHKWLGVGPGHFDVRFPQYRTPGIHARPIWAHNNYLNTLADWGIVGAVLVTAGLATTVWTALRIWKYVRRSDGGLGAKPSDRAAYVLGISVGLLALAVHEVVDFNLHIPATAMLAVTLLALLAGHMRFTTNRYWLNPRLGGRLLITVLGLASVAVLGQQAWQRYSAAEFEARAARAATFNDQLNLLRSAARCEPANAERATHIGEICRLYAWEGEADAPAAMQEAMQWFQTAIRLNPWDTLPRMRYGMSLDWLGRHDEALAQFDKAVALDPNNFYVAMMRGWHGLQAGNLDDAKEWLTQSLKIRAWDNPLARRYLAVVNQRLAPPSPPRKP